MKPARTAKELYDNADRMADDPKIQQELKERAKEIVEKMRKDEEKNKTEKA